MSIFDPTSPGHDGALLVDGSVIKSFGLHLPLARDFSEYSRVGTRHRAAAGITERTDAVAIVVSEERGEVSISLGGKLKKISAPEDLAEELHNFLKEDGDVVAHTGFWKYFASKNAGAKFISIALAFMLWFAFVYQAGVVNKEFEVPVAFKYVPSDLTVSGSIPTAVSVIITGNNADLEGFDSKDLSLIVDAKNAQDGSMKINISKEK